MIRLEPASNLYIDENDSGYAAELKLNKIFESQFDFLLLGFCYAVHEKLPPLGEGDMKRHDLRRVAGLKSEKLLIEVVASWYAEENGIELDNDPVKLLDLICRLGAAGMRALKNDWKDRDIEQIEKRIMNLGKSALSTNS